MRPIRVLDPLYGAIDVAPQDSELFFSPEFQRLRYVRLCNINSLFLTGASEPKRFEHCVGVYHLASRWAQRKALDARSARHLRSAALLHDLQTGPFGHSFQYVLEDNEFDKDFAHGDLTAGTAQKFYQQTSRGAAFAGREFRVPTLLGSDASEVNAAIEGKGPFGPLISGSADLDNIDNVVRLAFHMGLCNDAHRGIPSRLVDDIDLADDLISLSDAGAREMHAWCALRQTLYEYLLLDRGEFAAKAMLTLAVEKATDHKLLWPDNWLLTDDQLLTLLETLPKGEHQEIAEIVQRLRVGRLFAEIGVWTVDTIEIYETLKGAEDKRLFEAAVQERASVSRNESLNLCVHLILDHKKTERHISYYNRSSKKLSSIGRDSKAVHIGLFATNSREAKPTKRVLEAYSDAMVAEMLSRGVAMRLSKDPMAILDISEHQATLL